MTNINKLLFFFWRENDKYKLLVVKLIFPFKKIRQSTSPGSIDEYVEIVRLNVMNKVRIPTSSFVCENLYYHFVYLLKKSWINFFLLLSGLNLKPSNIYSLAQTIELHQRYLCIDYK